MSRHKSPCKYIINNTTPTTYKVVAAKGAWYCVSSGLMGYLALLNQIYLPQAEESLRELDETEGCIKTTPAHKETV